MKDSSPRIPPGEPPRQPRSYRGPSAAGEDDDPRLAIRRHTDRCFHRVEEVVREGYIVQGVLIDADEVAEVRRLDEEETPRCHPQPSKGSAPPGLRPGPHP